MEAALRCLLVLFVAGCVPEVPPGIDYLGQEPPGREVRPFAPGIVTTEHREHGVPLFAPDGREVFFSRQYEGRHDILWARRTPTGWGQPEPVPFTSDALDDGPAFFPIDGRLFFGSRRPEAPGGASLEQTDIWSVTRMGEGWAEPVRMGPPISSTASDGFPCFTADGTMYFHSDRGGDETLADIYRASWQNGVFGEPEPLPSPINTHLYEAGPYIAPDESYLIYMQVDFENPEHTRLLLTFRTDTDSWGEPVDLAEELDLPRTELLLGRVSPDQKYLFLLAGADIHWVDASIIAELREPH